MSHDNRNRFFWFLAGLGVGAVTVALYGPQSGAETRKALRSKAQQGRDQLHQHGNRVRERVSHLVDRSRAFLTQRKNQPKQDELTQKPVALINDPAEGAAKVNPEAASEIRDSAKKAI